ncbi:MAG TPA: sigma factor-like helix-turn-helix DNA-binding protein [Microlunatus sp.]
MAYVLTVDQISSRHRRDQVEATMATLSARFPEIPVTRTVGDEFQALFGADPLSVVDATLTLMREGAWHVGIGIGRVEQPTPADLREARGPAFLAARRAVEEAKGRPDHLRVVATPPAEDEAEEAGVLLSLVLSLRARRSPAGWAATDLSDQGLTQAEIGDRLGISRQAVHQRLAAAQWSLDVAARPVAARLLARADTTAADAGDLVAEHGA